MADVPPATPWWHDEGRARQFTETALHAAATARYCVDVLPYRSVAALSVARRAAA